MIDIKEHLDSYMKFAKFHDAKSFENYYM